MRRKRQALFRLETVPDVADEESYFSDENGKQNIWNGEDHSVGFNRGAGAHSARVVQDFTQEEWIVAKHYIDKAQSAKQLVCVSQFFFRFPPEIVIRITAYFSTTFPSHYF